MNKKKISIIAFILVLCLAITTGIAAGSLVLPKKLKTIDAEAFYQAKMIKAICDGVDAYFEAME